jgi:hypothetical protein
MDWKRGKLIDTYWKDSSYMNRIYIKILEHRILSDGCYCECIKFCYDEFDAKYKRWYSARQIKKLQEITGADFQGSLLKTIK